MTKDPFDLTDVSDLPERIRPKRERISKADMALALLQVAGRPVSTVELSAAMYRVHGVQIRLADVCSHLLSFNIRAGRIKRVGRGLYQAVGLSRAAE